MSNYIPRNGGKKLDMLTRAEEQLFTEIHRDDDDESKLHSAVEHVRAAHLGYLKAQRSHTINPSSLEKIDIKAAAWRDMSTDDIIAKYKIRKVS